MSTFFFMFHYLSSKWRQITLKVYLSKYLTSLINEELIGSFFSLLNNGEVTEEKGNFCEKPCK